MFNSLVCSCLIGGTENPCLSTENTDDEESSRLLYRDAERKLEEEELEECVRLLRESIEMDGNNVDALYLLGHLLGESGEIYLLRVVSLEPNHQKAVCNLGFLANERGKLNESASYLETAVELDPQDTEAWLCLGVVYKSSGNNQKATDAYLKALALNPQNETAMYNLATIYHDLDETDKSIEWYEKAIQINPGHFDAWYNLGVVQHEAEHFERALECFEKAVEIDPTEKEAKEHAEALRAFVEKKRNKELKKQKSFFGKKKGSSGKAIAA